MHLRPPAFVAILPPTVEISTLAGSGGKNKPCSRTALSRSAVITPASTTAKRLTGSMSRIVLHRSSEMTRPLAYPTAPPAKPVPAPRTDTASRCRWAHARAGETSAVLLAITTASGGPVGKYRELSLAVRSRSGPSVTTAAPRSSISSASAWFWVRVSAGMEVLLLGRNIKYWPHSDRTVTYHTTRILQFCG